MTKLFISLLMTLLLNVSYADDLKPFTSDGCSAFPDGTDKQNKLWLECCFAHDKAYWQGGSYSDRKKSDLDLRSCVANVGEPEVAVIMLAGVRIGGTPYLPTDFRWGYGWSYLRGYKVLSKMEQEEVRVQLIEYESKNKNN